MTLQAKHADDAAASSDVARVAEHAEPNLTCTMPRTAKASELEQVCPRQVKHAEDAGASGAIVYDDVYEALIIMSKPRDHAEPGIPSVFVAQKTGIVMRKLMTPGATIVRITPVRAPSLYIHTYIDHIILYPLSGSHYLLGVLAKWSCLDIAARR